MGVEGRTIAVSGAGRGLGAALAISLADRGAIPILLGRNAESLDAIAARITERNGRKPLTLACDLADAESCAAAAARLISDHPSIDGLVNNGAPWTPGAITDLSIADVKTAVDATVTGTMVLTRGMVAHFRSQPNADILTVVSGTGLANALLRGSSTVFKAAKAAQDAFVQGLAEELRDTPVRVQAVHPGFIRDVLPGDKGWDRPRSWDDALSDREVVDAILFLLSLPPNASVRSMMIERTTDYMLWPNSGEPDDYSG
jgi:NAD(P)-dependent dehydrogenase (short-subunit alcohol dehydrogenase family)